MQLLSPHLSLEELTFSSTAIAHGIDNTAPAEVVDHLAALAASLEKRPLDKWGHCGAII